MQRDIPAQSIPETGSQAAHNTITLTLYAENAHTHA